MRGQQERSGSLFSYVSIEERIPASHPLRRIRKLADQALDRLNPTFCRLYASEGRPSVPPDQLLLASLLPMVALGGSCSRNRRPPPVSAVIHRPPRGHRHPGRCAPGNSTLGWLKSHTVNWNKPRFGAVRILLCHGVRSAS